jgi:transcriptional regulator with XRE-family HTH domain
VSYFHHDPAKDARDRRQHAWWRWRRKVGLSHTEKVADLLGISVRTIQRYETAAQAPPWYQAALLGLLETWPDRKTARRYRPRKPKKDARGFDVHEPEPRLPLFCHWDPQYYEFEWDDTTGAIWRQGRVDTALGRER